jgi:hypothetical protein
LQFPAYAGSDFRGSEFAPEAFRRVWVVIKDVNGGIAHLQKVDVASENTRFVSLGKRLRRGP